MPFRMKVDDFVRVARMCHGFLSPLSISMGYKR
jgi:hypothetical protein